MRVSACVTQYLHLAELLISIGFQYFSAICGLNKHLLAASTVIEVDTLVPKQSRVQILERLRVKRRLLKMTFSFAISFLRVTFGSEVILLPLVTHSNTFFIFG